MMNEWETVITNANVELGLSATTIRLLVPDGWLVQVTDIVLTPREDLKEMSSALCFVPDREHAWKI